MNQEYFLTTENANTGPYDLVMLVRKIRNGSLTPEMPVQLSNNSDVRPAVDWPELAEFFQDIDEETGTLNHSRAHTKNFSAALKNGWHFFLNNQSSTIFSSILVLAIILMVTVSHFLIPYNFKALGYLISFALGFFLISCFMLSILRMVRGQPTDIAYIRKKVAPVATQLLLASFIISLPTVLGLVLIIRSDDIMWSVIGLITVAIPGMFVITLYGFTPLLILDQGYDFRNAIKTSQQMVFKNGVENFSILYALFTINFLAGLFLLLPMMVSLPVTVGAITEIYDEMFS